MRGRCRVKKTRKECVEDDIMKVLGLQNCDVHARMKLRKEIVGKQSDACKNENNRYCVI